MNSKVLVVLPVSIAGRLIVSSIVDGLKQNDISQVVVYDELFRQDLLQNLTLDFEIIIGYDFSPLKIKIDNNMPAKCICYFADNINSKTSGPEWQKYYKYLNRDDVYTFFWDRAMIKEYDIKNIYYMPQFTNFDVYRPMNIETEYDVMFAGRLDTDVRLNWFVSLMQKLSELKFAWYAIERHYQDALSRTPYKDLLKEAYKGFIDNEEDMAIATNKSKIVVTINAQGITSLNYRTIQTVACKTLLISDYREELDLYNGVLPYYSDIDDLADKIKYYISHPKEYQDVTNYCYNIGKKYCHSKENVAKMLSIATN